MSGAVRGWFVLLVAAMTATVTQMNVANRNYVWDTGTLDWIAETQPGGGAGGGGDASAANQVTGNASLASIDAKIPASPATAGKQDSLLTELQLKADLTETQPVSLATLPALVAGSAVIGHVIVDTAPTTAVTGPLTDGQLRNTAVPVSLATAPTTAVTNAGLSNLDVALSTRTKPADQQHVIIDSSAAVPITDNSGTLTVDAPVATPVFVRLSDGAVAVAPLTDTQLRATPVPVSGPVTDTQIRATPLPVSGSVSAAATLAAETTKVIGTVNVAAGQTIAVTGPLTDTQVRATPLPVSGTVTANTGLSQPLTDTQLRATAVPVSGTVTTKTDLTPSAPAAVSVGVASAQLLAANASRKGLVLVNTSNNRVSLGFGQAAVLDSGVTLYGPGGTFEMDEYSFDLGAVNAIASAAASNVAVQEYA